MCPGRCWGTTEGRGGDRLDLRRQYPGPGTFTEARRAAPGTIGPLHQTTRKPLRF
jgi:hypothetical protein